MSASSVIIYTSENGDRWKLIRGEGSRRGFVRHEANRSAGGKVTDTDVEEFLHRAGGGPEYSALRRLMGPKGSGS